uniref:Calponin-homology (CH) domain-containing protein n=1 Tax=Nannospalax galili TaxID=1026970 RepID=A0A8C6QIU1_NANGA
MATLEWDWFQREELIGQISDIRVQNLQVERENVQKRTFTRWINLHLEKCDPPLEVTDLFVDIQDGKILMALLEVLSGRNLVCMPHTLWCLCPLCRGTSSLWQH